MKEFWDSRYRNDDYAYGTKPNEFFKEVLDNIYFKGKMLLPAEGEGRNAVYAAKKGWKVIACDISIEGKNKALQLAKKNSVDISYQVGDFFSLEFGEEEFDLAALIFAHFPANLLSAYHKKVGDLIKPDGILILEGFSTNHLELRKGNPDIGGPDKIEMLFSIDAIKRDFPNFDIIQLEEKEIILKEGMFHNGVSKVIRFIGRKTV